jgi:hypothetical protein
MESGDEDLLDPSFISNLIKKFEDKGFQYFYMPEPPSN